MHRKILLFIFLRSSAAYHAFCNQWSFSGISTFAHMRSVKCLIEPEERYDIAVVGAPFDTAVTYRPGISPKTSLQKKADAYNNDMS